MLQKKPICYLVMLFIIIWGKSICPHYVSCSSQFPHLALKPTNFFLYVWEISKYSKFVTFSIKSNKFFLKKLLVVHHKEEKKLRIVLQCSYITFVNTVISWDLTEKVIDLRYLLISQTQKGKLIGFKDKWEIVNYPKHKGVNVLFPLIIFNHKSIVKFIQQKNYNCENK